MASRRRGLQVVGTAPVLRTCIVSLEGRFVQVILREGPHCSRSADFNISELRDEIVLGPPLVHIVLDSRRSDHSTFALIMYHAAVDGWSRSILMETLQRAYAGDVLH